MMIALSPTYTMRIEIQDRLPPVQNNQAQAQQFAALGGLGGVPPSPYKFYNGLAGKTGCDEVVALVKKALSDAGLGHVTVTLDRFEHKP